MPVILLIDNGSTQANATLQLRELAKQLGLQTGYTIHPVSLQHANNIPAKVLNNLPAQVFNEFMEQQLIKGNKDFILLPIFFGQGKALTKYIPDVVNSLKNKFGDFQINIADVIYPLPEGENLLCEIIHDHIQDTAEKESLALTNIVLVDHGSPTPQVTDVRKHLVQRVQDSFSADYHLEQAVMERREGSEYDFNGDLLENWLKQKAQSGASSVIVILLFFLAGRHAGKDGDIVEICASVMKEHPELKITISPLISEHPKFLSILESRLNSVIDNI
jgi:sirohydrochlorin ferrochelatase